MRQTREQTAITRSHIVDTAARVFREQGINGIGVADLMGEAGLTHGGFYKHFASKDALAAEACTRALAQTREALAYRTEAATDAHALAVLVETYLSPAHRNHPGQGCAIAALGSEAVRGESAAQAAMVEGVDALLQLIRQQMARSGVSETERPAHAVLAAMVGGLVLSRVLPDAARAQAVLSDTQAFILGRALAAATSGA
jgi:TetR/AcrR family transcriptional regulator, transcriptional repressor for nem operon